MLTASLISNRPALAHAGRILAWQLPRIARTFSSVTDPAKQHLVVALGGNALLKRGEKMSMTNQRNNIAQGMLSLEPVLRNNKITLVHGNGPQVGLLVLESAAYEKESGVEAAQLDVLDAETEGMIGYMLEQAMPDNLGEDRGVVTVLSQIEVDRNDPAFENPTKFIGPIMNKEEADKLGLPVKPDGKYFRRVVPSPLPVRLLPRQMHAVKQLTDQDNIVICAGGGGIPVVYENGHYRGIEAVIDKDRAACMMGKELGANGLLILTDVPGIAMDYGKDNEKWMHRVSPQILQEMLPDFPDGSMRPKVEACIDFVNNSPTGCWAAVGSLQEAEAIVNGFAGTRIDKSMDGIEFHDDHHHEPKVA